MKITRKQKWLVVVIYTLLIYTTIPIVRPLVDLLEDSLGVLGMTIGLCMKIIFIAVGLLFVYMLFVKRKNRKTIPYIYLIILSCIYVYILAKVKVPIERIHLIEYGFLAYFIYSAFRESYTVIKSYVFSFVLVAVFGWMDEGIQYFVPDRYYDIKDVGLNALSGLLALLMVHFVIKEKDKK